MLERVPPRLFRKPKTGRDRRTPRPPIDVRGCDDVSDDSPAVCEERTDVSLSSNVRYRADAFRAWPSRLDSKILAVSRVAPVRLEIKALKARGVGAGCGRGCGRFDRGGEPVLPKVERRSGCRAYVDQELDGEVRVSGAGTRAGECGRTNNQRSSGPAQRP
jgi:hypothetical protein